jgi:hypothetical protein
MFEGKVCLGGGEDGQGRCCRIRDGVLSKGSCCSGFLCGIACFSETEVRKCVMQSCVGVEGAHAICAIDGRRRWNRCRMWEVGLVDVWKRLLRDWWSLKGGRS